VQVVKVLDWRRVDTFAVSGDHIIAAFSGQVDFQHTFDHHILLRRRWEDSSGWMYVSLKMWNRKLSHSWAKLLKVQHSCSYFCSLGRPHPRRILRPVPLPSEEGTT
jgi:hypothetical protein